MPYRKILLINDQFYHVVNRSVASSIIFRQPKDYQRILEIIDFYRFSKPAVSFSRFKDFSNQDKKLFIKNLRQKKEIIKIIAFCIMPNHIHFLLKQNENKGISEFMGRIQNSFAKYINIKYERTGAVFQSMFKAIRIENDEQLLHVSRYIHLNPSSSFLIEIDRLKEYPWSSFDCFIDQITDYDFVDPFPILNFFKLKDDYKKFVFDQADYQRHLQEIKYIALED